MRSMTGFGRGRARGEKVYVQVDLRSLNHRFLEVRVRGLGDLPLLAARCEEALKGRFGRGTIEATVSLDFLGFPRPKYINREAAKGLWEELQRLSRELGAPPPSLEALLGLGVVQEGTPDEEALWPVISEALEEAMAALERAREEEGRRLREALLREADTLEELLRKAEDEVPLSLERLKEKLRESLVKLGQLDEARIALEVSIWAERADVREELDRLWAHLGRLRDLLGKEEVVGREMEFLSQEIGREANTLAAKSRGVPLGEISLELRLCAERIREQARNVE